MDFIPLHIGSGNSLPNKSPQTLKQNRAVTPNAKMKGSFAPQFGSPALSFGSPALSFGSPAVGNGNAYSTPNRQSSPRHYQPNNQRGYSPRFHHSNAPYTPPPHLMRPQFPNQNDGSGFKTPHQFSPGGRGNGGRKSISRQFGQTPRFDPNCNPGGSLNIEDYYHPNMVTDPWKDLKPVLKQENQSVKTEDIGLTLILKSYSQYASHPNNIINCWCGTLGHSDPVYMYRGLSCQTTSSAWGKYQTYGNNEISRAIPSILIAEKPSTCIRAVLASCTVQRCLQWFCRLVHTHLGDAELRIIQSPTDTSPINQPESIEPAKRRIDAFYA